MLSPIEARQLILSAQGLTKPFTTLDAAQSTLQTFENLGYIQIDTISVVERAHHHTLWTRNPTYQAAQLDYLLEQKQIFEYWSHAAAYLPMRDFRFSLPRKQALASGTLNHWYERDPKLMQEVFTRIRSEGPLMAKDFESSKPTEAWHSKPEKRALEYLFMQGELMIPYRKNFHKVYDLTERVLPSTVDTSPPSFAEYANYLIINYLKAHGLAQEEDFGYLLKGIKPKLKSIIKKYLQDGILIKVKLADQTWLTLAENLKLLNQPAAQTLKILSPFDNLLIQRERMRKLFDFDYQIECYIPATKRKYGYFSLPILWKDQLVARIDCKAERKQKTLMIHHLHLESTLKKLDEFHHDLDIALKNFAIFNRCDHVVFANP
ncbi:winged helix-turn-helix domain-containing protein [Thiolinea disciformis]|uniref:winged helix-turn-helix domain-containing protein n=1 Tax=Thiolinea disciformis TaxID=125614 RepID=UPI00037D53FB|nr:crosslink repair DNA glycosylase YcaQ family protein [Thiolinea disciformis]